VHWLVCRFLQLLSTEAVGKRSSEIGEPNILLRVVERVFYNLAEQSTRSTHERQKPI
jgi:hypothetical protein